MAGGEGILGLTGLTGQAGTSEKSLKLPTNDKAPGFVCATWGCCSLAQGSMETRDLGCQTPALTRGKEELVFNM